VELGDLQYACIFPLPDGDKIDCAAVTGQCDCKSSDMMGPPYDDLEAERKPLCQDPATGAYGQLQHFAKAYPGTRHLQVLKDFGDNSIVASICARNLTNPGAPDFGYRPAIIAIVERLKEALQGKCLPREVAVNEDGTYPCAVVEAMPATGPEYACSATPGRGSPDPTLIEPSFERLRLSGRCGNAAGLLPCDQSAWTLCEIVQAGDPTAQRSHTTQCETLEDKDAVTEVGWCYIDGPGNIGNPALVAKCDLNEQRILRFVGADTPKKGATALIACLGADLNPGALQEPPPMMTEMPPVTPPPGDGGL
jgi:hypothetical protein